jgi:ABC-type thiamine transport system substrate-binding protein
VLKKCLPLLLLCTAPVFAKPVLTVYTYDSFAADWGPGPKIKKAFEEGHLPKLNFEGETNNQLMKDNLNFILDYMKR